MTRAQLAAQSANRIIVDGSLAAAIIQEQVRILVRQTPQEYDASYEMVFKALVVYGAGDGDAVTADALALLCDWARSRR